jgi:hypothetical protein
MEKRTGALLVVMTAAITWCAAQKQEAPTADDTVSLRAEVTSLRLDIGMINTRLDSMEARSARRESGVRKGSVRPSSAAAQPLKAQVAPIKSTPTYSAPTPRTNYGSAGGYIRGPRGGCYYYTRSGRKRYVERSMCS